MIKIIKKLRLPLAILVILVAIIFSLFRALTPWATQYKSEVEQHLTVLLGHKVSIQTMETSWYWFDPVLKLEQVSISDGHTSVIKLQKLLVGINLLSSLWHWQIQPGILYIDNVHIILRQVNHNWSIDGLNIGKSTANLQTANYLPVLQWVLAQKKIIIQHVSVIMHLSDGTIIPFKSANFTALNTFGHYRLRGDALLDQKIATKLSIIANLAIDPADFTLTSGHVWIALRNFLPAQWQSFFPDRGYHIKQGHGDLEAWFDLNKGSVDSVQSIVNFEKIIWSRFGKVNQQPIEVFKANLAWKKVRDGWRLTSDHINLSINQKTWPENKLSLLYNPNQQTYSAYFSYLPLNDLLALDLPWPEYLAPIMAWKINGQLHDTQIELKDQHLNYILTRFDSLSWQGHDKIPNVHNLSGVLHWEPEQGRLELDSNQTTITPMHQSDMTFETLNAGVDWKELSDGWRISMDRLIIVHPELVISARGVMDNAANPQARQIRMTGEFSGNNMQHWLNNIPTGYLKPKLHQWLRAAIKKVDRASGQLILNGELANFPFDEHPGEFSIHSAVSGVNLLINRDWPINRDIVATINVDKRLFEANITQAVLKGVPINDINLRIDNIGLGQEKLLIHGQVKAPADKIKSYIYASPLSTHFVKLKHVDILDSLGLDLRLDIPLYAEDEHVLASGVLTFADNTVIFHPEYHPININQLSGVLSFDENGVVASLLKGTLGNDPLMIRMRSVVDEHPYTEIAVDSETSLGWLRTNFGLPIFALMHGQLKMHSIFMLAADTNGIDRLHITTALKGVAVNLPAPFGKSPEKQVPVMINAEIKGTQALNVQFKYSKILSGTLAFLGEKGSLQLKRGVLSLGGSEVRMGSEPGIVVNGKLKKLDINKWQQALAKLPNNSTQSNMFNVLRKFDLHIDNLTIFEKKYLNLDINAIKISEKEWSLKLHQAQIDADLRYLPDENSLTGHVDKLALENPFDSPIQHTNVSASLNPRQIPNLDLTIDTVRWGEIDVGSVALKSTHNNGRWVLDNLMIKAPQYQIRAEGDWTKDTKLNRTHLKTRLQIYDLSKTLERWHMTPVVAAQRGSMQFDGNWPGFIQDFSLAKADGIVNLTLNDGRITHLSKETEEKIGLGKLLSIVSLQTIPRRLKLDFSDLSEKGYSFDIYKGTFILKNGVMSTTDSYIDGPVAYASIKGDLDLVKRLYDLDLRVSPYIGASLPVVATIAGGPIAGPIAGIATWVAVNMINKGMQKISAYTYKVSGPWQDPIVQQVKIYKQTIPKLGT